MKVAFEVWVLLVGANAPFLPVIVNAIHADSQPGMLLRQPEAVAPHQRAITGTCILRLPASAYLLEPYGRHGQHDHRNADSCHPRNSSRPDPEHSEASQQQRG